MSNYLNKLTVKNSALSEDYFKLDCCFTKNFKTENYPKFSKLQRCKYVSHQMP